MREIPQNKINSAPKIPFNNGNPVPKGIDPEDFYTAASMVIKEEPNIKPKGVTGKGSTYLEKVYKKTIKRLPELLKKIEDRKAGRFTKIEDLSAFIQGTDVEETEKDVFKFIEKDILDKSHPQNNIN